MKLNEFKGPKAQGIRFAASYNSHVNPGAPHRTNAFIVALVLSALTAGGASAGAAPVEAILFDAGVEPHDVHALVPQLAAAPLLVQDMPPGLSPIGLLALTAETHVALLPQRVVEHPRALVVKNSKDGPPTARVLPLGEEFVSRLQGLIDAGKFDELHQALGHAFDFTERQDGLRALYPQAHVDLNVQDGYFYANRDRLPNAAQALYGEMTNLLRAHPEVGPQGLRVLDHNYKIPGEAPDFLFGRNIVDAAAASRVEGLFGAKFLYDQLSQNDRERLIYEPLARRLSRADGPLFLHVDHHYAPELLATTSTTPLLVDFLLYLEKVGQDALIRRLQRTFAIMDHSDADIVLANYVLRRAGEPGFLGSHEALLKGAAILNDYQREIATTPKARADVEFLYNVAVAIDKRIADGKLRYRGAFEKLDEAIAFIDRGRDAADADGAGSLELAREGAADYAQDVEALEPLLAEATVDAGGRQALKSADAGEIRPGTIRRVGPLIVVYLDEGERAIGNGSILRHLKSIRPSLLNGAYAIATTNVKAGSRFFKVRSFFKSGAEEGRFLNLADSASGVYALLNTRVDPLGNRYTAEGRHFGGGLLKGGFGALTRAQVVKTMGDIAAAAAESVALQFPPRSRP